MCTLGFSRGLKSCHPLQLSHLTPASALSFTSFFISFFFHILPILSPPLPFSVTRRNSQYGRIEGNIRLLSKKLNAYCTLTVPPSVKVSFHRSRGTLFGSVVVQGVRFFLFLRLVKCQNQTTSYTDVTTVYFCELSLTKTSQTTTIFIRDSSHTYSGQAAC